MEFTPKSKSQKLSETQACRPSPGTVHPSCPSLAARSRAARLDGSLRTDIQNYSHVHTCTCEKCTRTRIVTHA